jgi:O-antigen ligase
MWLSEFVSALPKRGLLDAWRHGFSAGSAAALFVRAACLSVCFVALAGSGSRGGLVACLVGFGVVAAVRIGGRGVAKALVFAGFVVVLDFAGGRLHSSGFFDDERLLTWMSSLRFVFAHPLSGTGYGTFVEVSPSFRDPAASSYGVLDFAHNLFVEVAVESGVPIALLLFFACLWACAVLVMGARNGSVQLAGVAGGCVAAVISTLVDFPLQITGVAIPVMAMAGWGISVASRGCKVTHPS